MAEVETAPAPAPAPAAAPAAKPGKKATSKHKSKPKSSPTVSDLICKAVGESKERGGMSLAAIKKYLNATGYNVEKNNTRVKTALRNLVAKGILVHVKGNGASGSFKLGKKAEPKKSGKGSAASGSKPKPNKPKTAASKPKTAASKPKTAKNQREVTGRQRGLSAFLQCPHTPGRIYHERKRQRRKIVESPEPVSAREGREPSGSPQQHARCSDKFGQNWVRLKFTGESDLPTRDYVGQSLLFDSCWINAADIYSFK
uniref:histone H1-like n=1 Tax=Epinephelus lanceolatus TaxID=310571 RepID=UPI001445B4D9|nr:histone H1-like [Epinephelus lanceolatus]